MRLSRGAWGSARGLASSAAAVLRRRKRGAAGRGELFARRSRVKAEPESGVSRGAKRGGVGCAGCVAPAQAGRADGPRRICAGARHSARRGGRLSVGVGGERTTAPEG